MINRTHTCLKIVHCGKVTRRLQWNWKLDTCDNDWNSQVNLGRWVYLHLFIPLYFPILFHPFHLPFFCLPHSHFYSPFPKFLFLFCLSVLPSSYPLFPFPSFHLSLLYFSIVPSFLFLLSSFSQSFLPSHHFSLFPLSFSFLPVIKESKKFYICSPCLLHGRWKISGTPSVWEKWNISLLSCMPQKQTPKHSGICLQLKPNCLVNR